MISRLPLWFRQEIPKDVTFIKNRLRRFENFRLNTVCLSAKCPNINTCFENNHVTFMISGDICSRNCSFCAVGKGKALPLNLSEPFELGAAISELNLKYAVITSVTRDDLKLGGATQYARAVYLIKMLNPQVKIELLIPDFNNSQTALKLVVNARPHIIGHNLETVEEMYAKIRPLGDYRRSLNVLKSVRELGFAGLIKSGIMLGFGETDEEVLRALVDLRKSDCDILTLGQYLSPSESNFPVREFISPEKFEFYRRKALDLGFKAVNCGPLVRSSYKAQEIYLETQNVERKAQN